MTNLDKKVYTIDQAIEDLQRCTTLVYNDKDCASMEAALNKACDGVATVIEHIEHDYFRLATIQSLGEIASKYIDRMNDLTDEDNAEVVLKAFLSKANPMLEEEYRKQQAFWGRK